MEPIHAKEIELNDQFKRALDLMENSSGNLFITGKAGTGKSTLLDYFRKTTKKKVAVVAPTGVAALNVQGQTIHSFFRFRPDVTISSVEKADWPGAELYKAIDTIIIDEVSMVRADLLDCIDRFLRINGKRKDEPFGGVQMIFIGDLYQLPPVVTGKEKEIFMSFYKSQYFFDSPAFGCNVEFVELEKIYRQKDKKFIDLLNSIRNNSVEEKGIAEMNKRLEPFFQPKDGEFYISLTSTNNQAAEINNLELVKLKGKLFSFHGKLTGEFDSGHLPTDLELRIKPGSQIMMVNNDHAGRWVNGSVGKITGIEKGKDKKDVIMVKFPGGEAEVGKFTWKMNRLNYDKATRSLFSESMGSFTQYPLRLAWAVTIHKSQGKTFDKVIIDIGKGTFAHGQMYVALSRCTNFDGLVLRRPMEKKHIWMDWKIVKFLTQFQYNKADKSCSFDKKMEIIQNAIKNRSKLQIVYLKSNDVKSKRVILPKSVGEMEYMGKKYTGLDAYCFSRKDDRIFRVDRILEIRESG